MRVGNDIAGRLSDSAVTVVRLAATLAKDPAGRDVASQLVRSATGGGVSYEEARAAGSREDFIHKDGPRAQRTSAKPLSVAGRRLPVAGCLFPPRRRSLGSARDDLVLKPVGA
jgi:hypothetical protein